VPFCLSRRFRPQVPLCPACTVGEVGSIRGPCRAPVTWRTRAGTKYKDARGNYGLCQLSRTRLVIYRISRTLIRSSGELACRGERETGVPPPRRRRGEARFPLLPFLAGPFSARPDLATGIARVRALFFAPPPRSASESGSRRNSGIARAADGARVCTTRPPPFRDPLLIGIVGILSRTPTTR